MSYQCEICGKGNLKGGTHRHRPGVASRKFVNRAPRTKRILKANLHWAKLVIDGKKKKMLLCTRCQRQLKKKNAPSPK